METRLRTVNPENNAQIVEEAASALRDGLIVALPTETVYGLGANRDHEEAMQRLFRLKNRPPGKPFTIHLADGADMLRYATGPNRFAHRLIERYWPGPLTVVVNTLKGASIGLRVPGNALAREIIRASGVPVALPSANPAGVSPACTAAQVMDFYNGEIDLVVDDGRSKIGDPSTVVKITDASFHVIRVGIITEEDIINTACQKILFICTGNTCRSPMAEGILKKLLSERLHCTIEELPSRGYLIQSAGVSAIQGEKTSLNAIRSLEKMNIDLSGHRTRSLSRNLIRDADKIYVMTAVQRQTLWNQLGEKDSKVEFLDRKDRDIIDPFGGSESVYSRCASQIYTNLLEIAETL